MATSHGSNGEYSLQATIGVFAVTTCAFFATLWLWNLLQKNDPFRNLPRLSMRSQAEQRVSMREAYDKYLRNSRMCKLEHPMHDIILLPMNLASEVKGLPHTDASWIQEVGDRFADRWTKIIPRHEFLQVMRNDFTKLSNSAIGTLINECARIMPEVVGAAQDWTDVQLQNLGVRIVSNMTGLLAAGPKLAHDSRWGALASTHIYNVARTAWKIWMKPWYLRRPYGLFAPELKKLDQDKREMRAILEPIVNERTNNPTGTKPTDILGAILAQKPATVGDLTDDMLALVVLAIHTTTTTLTDILIRLAAHPQYQATLLEEIEQALRGRMFAELTVADLISLQKLDSFIKEGQRLSPTVDLSLVRRVNRPGGIPLSNGTLLPQGTFIGTSGAGIFRDPRVFPEPQAFDGLRFYKLRQQPGHAHKHQFVSLSDYDTQFGAGIQPCAGRMLVSNEIKIVMAYILLHYDIDAHSESEETMTNVGTKPKASMRVRRKAGTSS